jgi:hypothetical protein
MAKGQVPRENVHRTCVLYYDLGVTWYTTYPNTLTDMIVPGDGLYEKRMKKEAVESSAAVETRWAEEGNDEAKGKPQEQDIVMGEPEIAAEA